MTMLLLVSCLCLSVVYTTASTVDTDQNTDTMKYLIRRIEVLENRDLQFREEMNAMRRKQDRQGREIASLHRVLGSQTGVHEQGEEDNVHEEGNKQPKSEGHDAGSTHGEIFNSVNDVQRIRRAEVDMNVAFFAKLSTSIPHLGHNQIVAFEAIETNESNAYNPHTGVFTAPLSGTYVFSATITTNGRAVAHYGFDHNGKAITNMYVNGAESLYESSSQTVVLQLNQGDDVSINHRDSDKNILGGAYSTFSGFLLHQSSPNANVVG